MQALCDIHQCAAIMIGRFPNVALLEIDRLAISIHQLIIATVFMIDLVVL